MGTGESNERCLPLPQKPLLKCLCVCTCINVKQDNAGGDCGKILQHWLTWESIYFIQQNNLACGLH